MRSLESAIAVKARDAEELYGISILALISEPLHCTQVAAKLIACSCELIIEYVSCWKLMMAYN